MSWKSRYNIPSPRLEQLFSDRLSPSQVKGYGKIIEGLQEQLSSLSIATPASLIRTGGSSVLSTSSTHVPAPSVMPTHPLTFGASAEAFAPAPVMGFSPDAQSKPTSGRSTSGRVQSDARRRDLLVSHDVFEFGADDSCKSRIFYAWQ